MRSYRSSAHLLLTACLLLLNFENLSVQARGSAKGREQNGAKTSAALDMRTPQIPSGVRYKEASPALNAKAVDYLRELFTGRASIPSFREQQHFIVGPMLWSRLAPTLDKVLTKRVRLMIPMADATGKPTSLEKEGRAVQSDTEAQQFLKAVLGFTGFSAAGSESTAPLRIRKLTRDELTLYWSMIPYDIEEPVLIVENGEHSILVQLTADLRIMWIDDFSASARFVTHSPEPTRQSAKDNASTGPVRMGAIVLYQPSELVEERTGSAAQIADFLRELIKEAGNYWETLPPGPSQSGFLVIAVKPGGRSRFWCDFTDASVTTETVEVLQKRLERVRPPQVKGGPVVIGVSIGVWGSDPAQVDQSSPIHIPSQWKQILGNARKEPLTTDEVIQKVWPD